MKKNFITDDERNELQLKMWSKLVYMIEELIENKEINIVQYTIARDVLYDCTVNHSKISYSDNIAQDFIDDKEKFVKSLLIGYNDMKKEFPNIDEWSSDKINEHSHEFIDCVY